MGYGGVIKKVAKIAVVAVASYVGGPIGAALASGAITAAEGGDFSDVLTSAAISGATSYAGGAIGDSLSAAGGAAAGAGTNAATQAGIDSVAGFGAELGGSAVGSVVSPAVEAGISAAAGQTAISSGATPASFGAELGGESGVSGFVDPAFAEAAMLEQLSSGAPAELTGMEALLADVPGIENFAPGRTIGTATDNFGIAADRFADLTQGGVTNVFSNNNIFGTLNDIGGLALKAVSNVPLSKLAGGIAAGYMDMSINNILALPEGPEILGAAGYTPQGIAYLSNQARANRLEDVFTGLQTSVPNPGLEDDQFNQGIAQGLQNLNVSLGPDTTGDIFDQTFGSPDLGNIVFRDKFNTDIDALFPNLSGVEGTDPLFQLGQEDIDSLFQNELEAARGPTEAAFARGILDPGGRQTAEQSLTAKSDEARRALGEANTQAAASYFEQLGGLRGSNRQLVNEFDFLGNEGGLSPINTEQISSDRQSLIDQLTGELPGRVSELFRSPFNPSGAVQVGAQSQGSIAGGSPQIEAVTKGDRGGRPQPTRRLESRSRGAF